MNYIDKVADGTITETFEMRLSAKMREVRLARNMTTQQVAMGANCTHYQINLIEDHKLPSLRIFLSLCAALKTSPNELLGWDEIARRLDP